MKITLIGGHGKVAQLAEPLLVEAGHEVRAVIRNPDQVADIEATGAGAVVIDIQRLDEEGWKDLIADSDAVVWTAGAGGGDPERTYAVDRDGAIASMDAAARAGARRYIMVSYFGAGPDHGVDPDNGFFAYAESKAAADEHLRGTDLDWTILGPSGLTMEEPSGRIDVEAEESSTVSRANVAQVIAAVIDRPETFGRFVQFNDGETPIPEAVAGL